MTTPIQPKLFVLEEIDSKEVLEIVSPVWQAAENLASPNRDKRETALDDLVNLNAHRFSPLVAFLIATRLSDQNLGVRIKALEAIAEVLSPKPKRLQAPDEVRAYLVSFLSNIDLNTVLNILKSVESDESLKLAAEKLLNLIPTGGILLSNILSDRKLKIETRQLACYFIGQIGFMDAQPILERIRNRITARQSGQQGMPFAPSNNKDESGLLPTIKEALELLRLPDF